MLRIAAKNPKRNKILATYVGTHSKFYFDREESFCISQEYIKCFIEEAGWRSQLVQEIQQSSKNLEDLYCKVPIFSEMKTEEIISLYLEQDKRKKALYEKAWIIEEMHSTVNSIENVLKALLPSDDPQLYSALMYTPRLTAFSEERKQITEAQKIEDLQRIWNRFRFAKYHGYLNPMIRSFKSYCHDTKNVDFNPEIKEMEKERCKIYAQKYNLPKETLKVFEAYAELGVVKSYRRLAELQNFYYLDRMLDEIAKRVNKDRRFLRFMTPEEIVGINGLTYEEWKLVEQRITQMKYIIEDGKEKIIVGGGCDQSNNFETVNSQSVLGGTVACPGIAMGKARVITEKCEVFLKGEIFISNEPNPELFDIIRNASAVVTDQGGITCHVASITRELNIPCIVGTGYATEYIKTGDFVKVDANKGIVEVIS